MEAPLPPGFTLRAAGPADVPAIVGLVSACEMANDGASEADASDVEQSLAVAGEHGTVVVTGRDGSLAAWATEAGGRAEVDVRPGDRGRGLGGWLLTWAEDRARETGERRVRQTVTDGDRAAHALFASRGYQRAHTSWILELPLPEARPRVDVPPGISIRSFEPGDEPAAYRLVEDAFNEWPGREPSTLEWWEANVFGHPAFSPSLSRLAFDGAELVGVALAADYPGLPDGWVSQLATRASHRHRGIARALLQASFAAFHDRGRRMVALSTDSRTGALTLYERLGMRIRRSYTSWTKDLR